MKFFSRDRVIDFHKIEPIDGRLRIETIESFEGIEERSSYLGEWVYWLPGYRK